MAVVELAVEALEGVVTAAGVWVEGA